MFVCEICGYESLKWMGRCPSCKSWESLIERKVPHQLQGERKSKVLKLSSQELIEERIVLGIGEMDRVLGGGLVRGSSILLGGDPGIGKTTLCFQVASKISELGGKCLYVSGEESVKQLAQRRTRLSLKGDFSVLVTNDLSDILFEVGRENYDLVIVDSIQSIYDSSIPSIAASIAQLKNVSMKLIRSMKEKEEAHILIGHVTKEGQIAGPKLIEHMVDTVLYFEGEKVFPYRILRAVKNRYGPSDEVGIFQMTENGLLSVRNPSEYFMSERVGMTPGSSLFPHVSGSRSIIVEVQALTPKSSIPNPKRISLGYDVNRLYVLCAILEKLMGRSLFGRDVFVNITGGIRISEPAIDLAVVASIISSAKEIKIGKDISFFGEVGLTGEVRKVIGAESRIRESERMGIKRVVCPKGVKQKKGIEVIEVDDIGDLYSVIKNL